MMHLKNIETDEQKTMSITDFMEWFNNDRDNTGYFSQAHKFIHIFTEWEIRWVPHEHPHS